MIYIVLYNWYLEEESITSAPRRIDNVPLCIMIMIQFTDQHRVVKFDPIWP